MNIQLSDHFDYKRLFRFVISPVAMMLFTSIYGVVDGFFVSNFAGKTDFAAINLIMPFLMILGGTGFMVGTGGTALVSKVMGEGDGERANRYFTMMIKITLIMGVVLDVVGFLCIRPVSVFFGATEAMMPACVLYGRIVAAFGVTFMLQNVFQSFLIAAERPDLGFKITVAAGVTNMVLDALFVGLFKWGVAGAAVATGLSQTVGGVLPLIFFCRQNGSPLRLVKTKLESRPILKAFANGSSELMSNIAISVVSILYNFQLMKYLGEDGVSAYGVLMYVQFIFISLFIGYSIGVAPIVGFNFGAQNHAELKNVFKKSVLIMGIAGTLMAAVAFALAGVLSRMFVGYDEALCALTVHAFRLFSVSFVLTGFNIFSSSFFTALNNGGISAAISFLRALVFQSGSVILLPRLFGVDGIWWAISVAEIFAALLSAAFLTAKRNKYHYI